MQLAQLANTSTKEHLTTSDLNMLENAQKYASKRSVQTLDSIVDGLKTPSLSPSESSEPFFDEDLSDTGSWIRRANMIISSTNSADGNILLIHIYIYGIIRERERVCVCLCSSLS